MRKKKMKEATLDNGTDSLKLPNKVEMNNPGIDLAIWKQLRKKWNDLDADGYKLKIDFRLVADPNDENNILAIDVIQHINDELITETVQRSAGEAYSILGLAGLSKEGLIEVYKEMLHQLHQQAKRKDADLIVTMSPGSSTSGETKGYVQQHNSEIKESMLVDYHHYYVLNMLWEKMMRDGEDGWSKVRAVYRANDLEFYFDY